MKGADHGRLGLHAEGPTTTSAGYTLACIAKPRPPSGPLKNMQPRTSPHVRVHGRTSARFGIDGTHVLCTIHC